jgi:hypothetical protein
MSRKIDFDKPLSDEDKEWLHGWSQDYLIDENARKFDKAYQKSTGPEIPRIEVNAPAAPRDPRDFPNDKVATGPVYPTDVNAGQVQQYADTSSKPVEEEVDINDLTVDELKDELRKLDEPVSGTKDELVKRLSKALED